LLRVDTRDYPEVAVREALLNSLVHRDYSFRASTLISVYDDRIEFVSVGGLLPGLELEDLMMGISACRNSHLANVFYRLQLIEAYGGDEEDHGGLRGCGLSAANHGHEQRIQNRSAQHELRSNGSGNARVKQQAGTRCFHSREDEILRFLQSTLNYPKKRGRCSGSASPRPAAY
ncbi:MAG: ATP-binding protein, partial [Collinsella sp.]